ncbi:hypothetical protein [Brevibacillus dissolubilis]|uniref:hypothetical protein n=1 Tax=Brevibacillus dissolubilis TaxID=1844116 RepID=UPI0011166FC7|nr:hypothetical protein [Brevibacillus dissolubilis]
MLERAYGLEMEIPSGKLPGFYAQMVHKIGDEVKVADRDQKLFIVDSEEELEKLSAVLTKYQALGERFELWRLPEGALGDRLTDFGFESVNGRLYLYDHLVAFCRVDLNSGAANERVSALEQMKLNVLSVLRGKNETVYVVDENHVELVESVAKRFDVQLEWIRS